MEYFGIQDFLNFEGDEIGYFKGDGSKLKEEKYRFFFFGKHFGLFFIRNIFT